MAESRSRLSYHLQNLADGPSHDQSGPEGVATLTLTSPFETGRAPGTGAVQTQTINERRTDTPERGGERFIAIDAVAQVGAVDTLFDDLRALGLVSGAQAGRMVSGLLPVSAVAAMEGLESLAHARPAYAVTASQGIAQNQGDLAMNADIARDMFGVDGSGVRIGVLSDSYDFLNGEAADIQSGDLPPGVVVLQDFSQNDPSDEGRAMLQIIHDVAPGADLSFATAFGGQANFARNIRRLADSGADVIVDDIAYLAEPFFQDGLISQAVDEVVAEGAVYFASAGNQGRASYEAEYRNSGIVLPTAFEPGAIAHDWNPSSLVDPVLDFVLEGEDSIFISLQWDQPFGSLTDGGLSATTDVDIYLVDENGDRLRRDDGSFVASLDPNIGTDPVEIFRFENESEIDMELGLVVEYARGVEPDLLKIVFFDSSDFIREKSPEYTSEFSNPTVVGHSGADGAIAVGAAFYQNTPRFGASTPRVNNFSSRGPTTILFDEDGARLDDPIARQKPEIVAPDGVDTTFFGSSDLDNTGFNNFFGTSAAAPQAAAVAALLLEANPSLTPEDIRVILQDTADNIGVSGIDDASGAGLIQADAAVAAALALNDSAPIPADDLFTASEDMVLTGDLFADNGAGPDEGPDGFVLAVINGAPLMPGEPLTLASGAVLTAEQDGTFTYDPREAFNGLAEGESTTDSFTYRLAPAEGGPTGPIDPGMAATATVVVTGANDAPVPQNDQLEASANAPLTANLLEDNGFGPDGDPDGDDLQVVALDGEGLDGPITLASGAVVTATANGLVTYDPGEAFTGLPQGMTATDSFSYTVSDGSLTASATVSVSVTAQNDAPIAQPDAFSLAEDTVLTGSVLVDNGAGPDFDPDGDSLVVSLIEGPLSGDLLLGADGQFTYTPQADFFGNDTFRYAIEDAAGATDTAAVTLTVTPVNDAPVARADTFATQEDTSLSGSLLADNGAGADTDPEGETLSVVAVNGLALTAQQSVPLPSGASLSAQSDGSFVYDPAGAFADLTFGETATDAFTYTLEDASGGQDTATATVSIEGEDAVITFGPAIGEVVEGTGAPRPFTLILERSGALDSAVDVAFAVEGVGTTPADGADFVGGVLPEGTVSFAPGETQAVITFAIAGDAEAEDAESFLVTLSDAVADRGAAVINGASFGVVINDDDGFDVTIAGTPGDDILLGTGSPDVIDGAAGNDAILAMGGNDILLGGSGDDVLLGSSGSDILIGGTGDDLLRGGAGNDMFVFSPGGGTDRVLDFRFGDLLDLRSFPGLTIGDVLGNLTEVRGDTILTLPDGTQIVFDDIDRDDIDPDQILLASA